MLSAGLISTSTANEALRKSPLSSSSSFSTIDTIGQWQAYVDYFKCINTKGEDFKPCKQFSRVYHSMCPVDWVERCVLTLLLVSTLIDGRTDGTTCV